MKEKKHIDRLYQEKFKNFEASPNEMVWKNISARIHEKKTRKIFPFWSRIAGIAAALAVFFSVGYQFWPNSPVSVVKVEDKPFKAPNDAFKASSGLVNEGFDFNFSEENFFDFKKYEAEKTPTAKITEEAPFQKPKLKEIVAVSENTTETDIFLEENIFNLTNEKEWKLNEFSISDFAVNSSEEKVDFQNEKNPLIKLATEKEEKPKNLVEENTSKLKIGTFASPIYYNGFGESSIDPQLANNEKKGEITMSYGINLSFAVTDKIKIRSGISRVDMSYNTMGVVYGSSGNSVALRHVNYNGSAETIAIQDASAVAPSNLFEPSVEGGSSMGKGFINQQIGFIELPLEVAFVLVDKQIGLNIIGGASTLIVNENSVSINSADSSTLLGESNNLNPVSFSTNIGLGVDYQLSKKFQINIEPMFKYQLNTFSSGNLKPYYLGVYSGISYKF